MPDYADPARNANEGVIKFECVWRRQECVSEEMIAELRPVRRAMWSRGLIGIGPDGIGYGNLSRRMHIPGCKEAGGPDHEGFLITGSQTGHLIDPGPEAYSYVFDWDIRGNRLDCAGLCRASSESLTHAAFYELSTEILAVLHVHSEALWSGWPDAQRRTRENVAYGTQAMAGEIRRIFVENGRPEEGAICMAGHRGGIIAWGCSAEAVCGIVLGLN